MKHMIFTDMRKDTNLSKKTTALNPTTNETKKSALSNSKKTDGSPHPEVPSQIDKREFATLSFWASPIVALKLNPSKYSGETNSDLPTTKPCRFLRPNCPPSLKKFSALFHEENFFEGVQLR
jgi:hypothetical protein